MGRLCRGAGLRINMKPLKERSFYLHNFGCKVNQEEGAALAALFLAAGWRQTDTPEAGLIIVNTCTVTQVADKKARNLIRRFAKEQPEALLAVCGCYAQRAAAEIAELDAADLIVGVEERRRLPELVEELLRQSSDSDNKGALLSVSDVMSRREFQPIAAQSQQSRARAYLKIEDGCDQFCRYCIIPYARGPVRSLPPEEAVEQARRLLDQGHKEIVLSGIHVGAYGKDLGLTDALPRLIESLCGLPGLLRLRLGSIEPQQFTPELLALLETEPKLCPHLHIPLQSGCDRTLAEMGRRYDTAFYAALLADIRSRMDDPAITCDVMVGFPGETEADFAASRDFCAACGFADLHIFPYSRRSGTPAAERRDQVRQSDKARRAAELARVARQSADSYARRWQGRALRLLVEERVELDGRIYLKGHSDNYLTLLLPDDGSEEPVRRVSIVSGAADGLIVREVAL